MLRSIGGKAGRYVTAWMDARAPAQAVSDGINGIFVKNVSVVIMTRWQPVSIYCSA